MPNSPDRLIPLAERVEVTALTLKDLLSLTFDELRVNSGISAEQLHGQVSSAAGAINSWYQSLTFEKFMQEPSLTAENSHLTDNTDLRLLKNHRSADGSSLSMAEWHKLQDSYTLLQIQSFGPTQKKFLAASLPGLENNRFAKLLDELPNNLNKALENFDIGGECKLFHPIITAWQQELETAKTPEQQAGLIQFIYKVANPWLEKHGDLGITVDLIYHEWKNSTLAGKTSLPDDPEVVKAILNKVKSGLAEMALASVSASSAWGYVGNQLPTEFIKLLYHSDREFSLKLFNDILGLASKNVLIYPPQLYYLFEHLLDHDYRPSTTGSLESTLEMIYSQNKTLANFADRLNFIVTGDNRPYEYGRFLYTMLAEVDDHGALLMPFSGPPNTALTSHTTSGWRGALVTIDSASPEELINRALALDNELSQEGTTYTPAQLNNIIRAKAGRHYPVTDKGWNNHLTTHLPNYDHIKDRFPQHDFTYILSQRGGLLYLSDIDQLQQIIDELRLLSSKPGSVYIATKGVVNGLVVDSGFKRNADGTVSPIMLELTDSAFPFNTDVQYYLHGYISEGTARFDNQNNLVPKDIARSPNTTIQAILFNKILANYPTYNRVIKNSYIFRVKLPELLLNDQDQMIILNDADAEFLSKTALELPKNNRDAYYKGDQFLQDLNILLSNKDSTFTQWFMKIKLRRRTSHHSRIDDNTINDWAMRGFKPLITELVSNFVKHLPEFLELKSLQTLKIYHKLANNKFKYQFHSLVNYYYFGTPIDEYPGFTPT